MEYLKHIAVKLKYNPVLSVFLDALSKIGIRIQPFYVFAEKITQQTSHHHGNISREYEISFLQPENIDEIASMPSRNVLKNELLSRLESGNICLGVKHNDKIVSFIWCSLNECHYEGYRFTLENDEAYIFDTYTVMDYRGRKLAVFLRKRLYEELKRLKKTTIFSVSNRFYMPAVRYKMKLNACIVDSGIYFDILNLWQSKTFINQDRLMDLRKRARTCNADTLPENHVKS